jgi:hypothetical protein
MAAPATQAAQTTPAHAKALRKAKGCQAMTFLRTIKRAAYMLRRLAALLVTQDTFGLR